jgi:2-polyprenyl-3-methyl-5-hydroxy-6-metoxy-1,4-benzoquinol methylase
VQQNSSRIDFLEVINISIDVPLILKMMEAKRMASVKEHYDNLLAEHYTWMFGDYDSKVQENLDFLEHNGIIPRFGGKALDLGCGSGFQSIALAKLGFVVLGIDLCESLLEELQSRSSGLDIDVVQGDMLDHRIYSSKGPFEVAVCMGDTLTHLPEVENAVSLFEEVYNSLEHGGSLVLTFRDLTTEFEGTDRIIPVRTDEDKLMAVFLEYEETHVNVHDMIFVKGSSGWDLKKSVYRKLRIGVDQVQDSLERIGYKVDVPEMREGSSVIVARK